MKPLGMRELEGHHKIFQAYMNFSHSHHLRVEKELYLLEPREIIEPQKKKCVEFCPFIVHFITS